MISPDRIRPLNAREALLANISPQRIIELTRSLIQCDSIAPPGNEYQALLLLKRIFLQLGLEVSVQEVAERRFNLIGRLKSLTRTKPSLMYLGHIDVVPPGDAGAWSFPPFSGMQQGIRIYGRGACDMKGSIACVVHAVEAILKSNITLDGDLLIVIDVDEEVSNLGLKKIIAEGLEARYCIVGEPTGLQIAIGHKGVISFHFYFQGKAVHASQADQGVNAIYHAQRFSNAIIDLNRALQTKRHPLLGAASFNVTTIRGGTKTNTIPDQCELTVDCRLLPGETKESCRQLIDGMIQKLQLEDDTFNCRYQIDTYCAPGEISPQEEVVTALQRTVGAILETTPELSGFSATCEASMVRDYLGIPSVICGPGSIAQAHNVNEYIEIPQLVRGCEIYANLFVEMLLNQTGNNWKFTGLF